MTDERRPLLPDAERLRRYHRAHPALFARLAEGQDPQSLFIGCSDSRVVPGLLVSDRPGDVFVLRNVANIVPPLGDDPAIAAGAAAAIEFAVGVLGVSDVVVCGHSGCGGVAALRGGVPHAAPHLRTWVELARPAALPEAETPQLDDEERLTIEVQRNVLLSLDRLAGYPLVADALARDALRLHGWYLDIADGRVLVYDAERDAFVDDDAVGG